MAERRKQVITAAHVHYAGRGFTSDPPASIEYFEALENCMKKRFAAFGRTAGLCRALSSLVYVPEMSRLSNRFKSGGRIRPEIALNNALR